MTKRIRIALVAAAAALGTLSMLPQQASAGECTGRKSYLSDACTFCQWGGACGDCTYFCTNPPTRM